MVTTDMKDRLIRVCTICGMAIQTLIRGLGINQQSCLIEIAQVALVESHAAIHLVARWNTSIDDAPLFQWIIADFDYKFLELCPQAIFLSTDGETELTTLVLL